MTFAWYRMSYERLDMITGTRATMRYFIGFDTNVYRMTAGHRPGEMTNLLLRDVNTTHTHTHTRSLGTCRWNARDTYFV